VAFERLKRIGEISLIRVAVLRAFPRFAFHDAGNSLTARYPTHILVRQRMKKTKADYEERAVDRDLYSGLIRLHILHHAVEGPIFGLGMAEELARHGYRISPGTLYPLLHGLELKGYLRATEQRQGKSLRRVYRATALGRKALKGARTKVQELIGELMEGK
jgi:PadR family transcriptional regulator, regulatory protein PadR